MDNGILLYEGKNYRLFQREIWIFKSNRKPLHLLRKHGAVEVTIHSPKLTVAWKDNRQKECRVYRFELKKGHLHSGDGKG
jgi:hypothetical protein